MAVRLEALRALGALVVVGLAAIRVRPAPRAALILAAVAAVVVVTPAAMVETAGPA